MKKLLVLTANFANDETGLTRFRESCEYFGLDWCYYGKGDPWIHSVQAKLGGLIKFLETEPEYEYILFADGWDSWMLTGEREIVRKFEEFDSSIVFAGHTDCYPRRDLDYLFDDSPTRFKYMCAGQFMGERDALLEAAKVARSKAQGNSDQGAWNNVYANKYVDTIAIDYHCKLFLTMSEIKLSELHFKRARPCLNETGYCPVNIHFGGPKGGSAIDVRMNTLYDDWRRLRDNS